MQSQYLTAKEVTRELGISFGTLYSYVSRGLIRSEETNGTTRHKRYWAADVSALRNRREQRRNPTTSAATALDFGDPVLESAITQIKDGKLLYRGYPAVELAASHSLEAVAGLLWSDQLQHEFSPLPTHTPGLQQTLAALLPAVPTMLTPVERFHMLLPIAEAQDLAAHDKSPAGICRTGTRIYSLLLTAITGQLPAAQRTIAEQLDGWRAALRVTLPHAAEPHISPTASPAWVESINAALILCADHELNVSSFTARCVASTGATPYGAVAAALAALQGPRHGGDTARCEALIRDAYGNPRQALSAWLRRGERLPGFGHRLYPDGDPRAHYLLNRLRQQFPPHTGEAASNDFLHPPSAEAQTPTHWPPPSYAATPPADAVAAAVLSSVDALIHEVDQTFGLRPNIDLALATLVIAAQLPPGAALTLFATGRLCGWIAHIIEQNQTGALIRPRARYTGPDSVPEHEA